MSVLSGAGQNRHREEDVSKLSEKGEKKSGYRRGHAEGARAALRARRWRYLEEASPRTIEAALSYLEEASPEALATHRVRLVALADRAAAAPGESQPSTAAPLYDEGALD